MLKLPFYFLLLCLSAAAIADPLEVRCGVIRDVTVTTEQEVRSIELVEATGSVLRIERVCPVLTRIDEQPDPAMEQKVYDTYTRQGLQTCYYFYPRPTCDWVPNWVTN